MILPFSYQKKTIMTDWLVTSSELTEKMAQLFHCGLFISNGEIYIVDTFNHRVRKVLRNGQIVTIAGNGIRGYNGDDRLATDAQLFYPHSVVSSSDQVYISERSRIRKIDRMESFQQLQELEHKDTMEMVNWLSMLKYLAHVDCL